MEKTITLTCDLGTIELTQPEVAGWEFKNMRKAQEDEMYWNGRRVIKWMGRESSIHAYWIATQVEPQKQRYYCNWPGVCASRRTNRVCAWAGRSACRHYVDEIITKENDPATDLDNSKTPDASEVRNEKEHDDMKAVIGRLIRRVERLEKRAKKLESDKAMRGIADAELAHAGRKHTLGLISFEDWLKEYDRWVRSRRSQ